MISGITPKRMLLYAVIGAGSLGLTLFGQPSEDTNAAAAKPEAATGSKDATFDRPGRHAPESTLDAKAAAYLTQLSHRTAAPTNSAHLFATQSWFVPPPPPPPPPPAAPTPPPVPVAPPLPFVYLGSYAAQGDKPTYFLSRADRIYDVRVGDAIDGIYSLDAADANNLIFTYKPLNARQSLSAGGAP